MLVGKMRCQLVQLRNPRLEREPDRLADRRHDVLGFAQRRERHEEGAVGNSATFLIATSCATRVFPLPPVPSTVIIRTAGSLTRPGQCRQFLLPPDERRRLRRDVVKASGRRWSRARREGIRGFGRRVEIRNRRAGASSAPDPIGGVVFPVRRPRGARCGCACPDLFEHPAQRSRSAAGASGRRSSRSGTRSFSTDWTIAAMRLPVNGGRPVSISKSTTPNAQMSVRASRDLPLSASGLSAAGCRRHRLPE